MSRRKSVSPQTVVAFGETLWDQLPTGAVLGGAPFNFAYRVSSLGDRGIIITRVGNDRRGRAAIETIATLEMEIDYVQRDARHPTGSVEVTLDPQKNPEFNILPDVAYDFIEPTPALLELATTADCIYFGTLVQRSDQTRDTLYHLLDTAGKRLKVLDINLRRDCFSPSTIENSLERADILKMNVQEAHYLADLFEFSDPSLPSFCEELVKEWSLSHCLVTLGEHGVLAVSQDGGIIYEPGYRVEVVDTCGAGDAFAAGFIHAFLRKESLLECCRLGNALGALVAMRPGATSPVTRAELDAFLADPPDRIVEPTLDAFHATADSR